MRAAHRTRKFLNLITLYLNDKKVVSNFLQSSEFFSSIKTLPSLSFSDDFISWHRTFPPEPKLLGKKAPSGHPLPHTQQIVSRKNFHIEITMKKNLRANFGLQTCGHAPATSPVNFASKHNIEMLVPAKARLIPELDLILASSLSSYLDKLVK